ncbi:hypothetical protein [Lapidilactobacillus wuchangensis]|uniref:hypothetical protein n=1 Tax=Lapidilactobacillus wuchangensis TaxID=2486001 RepID=UPI000F7A9357|nr:hypothetical protein [Lapidilactobacillus wuchangensis]
MKGVVVSRQIIVGALAPTIRPVSKTFEKRLRSASTAFHNQQARNEARRNSVSTSSSGFNGFEPWSFNRHQLLLTTFYAQQFRT